MIFNFIKLYVFLVSFAIGIFVVYIYGTDMTTIYIYPTPENVGKVYYKDRADNCFYFEEEVVECPKDKTLILNIPIQA